MKRSVLSEQLVRFALFVGLLGLLGVAIMNYSDWTSASYAQQSDGRVTHTVNGNTEVWRIDEPNVKKPIIEFPQIRFVPGDQVRVTAGGCVQTGGHGKTWKRYLDPLPASDQKYHGMVLIPGAIGQLPADSLSRFARILIERGTTFTVKAITEPRKQHLWLGYEDDDYGDNGYWGQDEGTQGQCRIGNSWVEHAFVVVTITHGGPPPPPNNLAPFDLSVNSITPNNPQVDDNLILFNPMWGRQITNRQLPDRSQCGGVDPYSSPCTTQGPGEDHGYLCEFGTLGIVDGHHNWVAGTYEGTIFWNDKSCDICDGDYNFRLVRPDDAGMTTANKDKQTATGPRKSMKLEFSSNETIDQFDTPWWNLLHSAVDSENFSAVPSVTAGTFGIVTGLVSLDCPHTCASELHPVWAMALRVNDDPADETWAIFVRRFGNEGFCSDQQHYLDDLLNDTYTFRLPWRSGASSVGVNPTTNFKSKLGQATAGMSVAQNQGVLISFTMPVPDSDEGEMVNGELHLKWSSPGGRVPSIGPFASLGAIRSVGRPPVEREDEPEDRLAHLVTTMTPAQRSTLEASLPRRALARNSVPLVLGAPRPIATLPTRSLSIRARRPRVRAMPDSRKKSDDERKLNALRAIYGNNIPGFPPPSRRRTP